jgi:sugar phosphate isomerase/epimerase
MLNRRKFIGAGAAVTTGLLMNAGSFAFPESKPLLSFSTLGCPKWTLEQILDFAVQNKYAGIELRGLLGEMNLPKLPAFSSAPAIAQTKKQFAEKGLKIVNLGASAEMHHADAVKRKTQLDGAKEFIDLAAALGCPYIRVFPNALPKDQQKSATLALIAEGLQQLGNYAKGTGVSVLMETHGELVFVDDVLLVMQEAATPNVGLVWDFYNMYTITHEAPAQVYAKLAPYIRHTHIKDSKKLDGVEHYVFLGQGDAPAAEALKALQRGGYKGFYSFEWEKMWHPEIAEPELALADFPVAFKKIMQ